MADFGAIQPRQFILDSSRSNGATLGEFHQNNNRYLCTMELFDNSVPVTIPVNADISIKCKPTNGNIVYVLDKNNPDFTTKVSFTPGENKIVVDRWGAMVANSRYTSTVEANRAVPKKFLSKAFTFSVKKNESYRVLAKSNKDDGCYLQSSLNGSPLFYSSIVFDEIEPIDQRIIDLINNKNNIKFYTYLALYGLFII